MRNSQWTANQPAYVWNVQDLAQGEGGVITITGVLRDPLAVGTFSNTATIATTAVHANPGNNSDDAVVTILTQKPSLSVTKSVAGAGGGALDLPLGSVITYTIVLVNNGAGVANNVVMTDPLPSAVSFGSQVQGSALLAGNTYQWGPYDVAAHTAYTISLTANATDSTDFAGQTITNTAYVSAANANPTCGAASFTIAGDFHIYLPLVVRNG